MNPVQDLCQDCIQAAYSVTTRAIQKAKKRKHLDEGQRQRAFLDAVKLVRKNKVRCRAHDIEYMAALDRPLTEAEARRAAKYVNVDNEEPTPC